MGQVMGDWELVLSRGGAPDVARGQASRLMLAGALSTYSEPLAVLREGTP